MRFEKGHKAATRQRIVEVASERFRKDGVAAVGIAGVMADAGLTHGGFYAHFGSKEDLVREAMVAAFEGAKNRPQPELKPGESALERRIRSYLRPAHRDTRNADVRRRPWWRRWRGMIRRRARRLPRRWRGFLGGLPSSYRWDGGGGAQIHGDWDFWGDDGGVAARSGCRGPGAVGCDFGEWGSGGVEAGGYVLR